jgi:hypothetical protein
MIYNLFQKFCSKWNIVDSLYQFELVRFNWIISLSRSQRYTSCEDIHVEIRGGTFPTRLNN